MYRIKIPSKPRQPAAKPALASSAPDPAPIAKQFTDSKTTFFENYQATSSFINDCIAATVAKAKRYRLHVFTGTYVYRRQDSRL